jgi:hypothetical protein
MDWETVTIISIGILGVAYFYRQSRTNANVSDIAQETMPLWASFAPFKDGHDSASVLYYCQWATQGKKFVDKLENLNAYKNHANSFNHNPNEWYELVKKSAKLKVDGLENKRRLVTALFELDRMKEDSNLPEWKSYYALGHIVTSSENKIAKSFYEYLQNSMETNKEIAKETINLIEDYVIYTGNEIDATMSAGFLCFVCLKYANENPNLELSKTIKSLNDQTFEEFDANKTKPARAQ